MSSSIDCPNCGLTSPPDATACDCGTDLTRVERREETRVEVREEAPEEAQPAQDPRSFAERRAGLLLLSAFLVSGVLRIATVGAEVSGILLIADGIFFLVAVFAGSGYLARRIRKKRLEYQTERRVQLSDC